MRWMAIITTLVILSRHATLKSTKILSIFIQVLGTVYSLLFLVTLTFKTNFPNYLNTIRPVGEHYQLASLLVVSIPLIFSNLLAKKVDKKIILLSKIALSINLVALVFTFARGAWLVILLLPVLLVLVKKESVVSLKKYKIMLILILGAVIGVISFGLSNDLQHSNNKIDEARSFKNLHQQSLNFKSRISYYSQALNRFKPNPVWGTGLNTYTNSQGEIISTRGITSYTHNFLLQMLTETGIFSLVIFVVIFSYIVYQLFTKTQKASKPTNVGVFLAFSLSLLYSFYDFNLNLSFTTLAVFSLAILVICNSDNPRKFSLTKLGSFLNGFLILCLVALEVFIVTGLFSTILNLKADHFKENGNHEMASELYLNSLKIFPFAKNDFQEAISYFDYYFPEKSSAVIEKWTKVNSDDGIMYIFLANRSLNNRDPQGALKYINRLLESELRPVPDSGMIKRLLELNRPTNSAEINPDLLKFIRLFNVVNLRKPNIYFDWPTVNVYYETIINLSRNSKLNTLKSSEQKLIFDEAFTGHFILDASMIDNTNELVSLLDNLQSMNPDDNQYKLYKMIILELSSENHSLDVLDELVYDLKLSSVSQKQAVLYNILLSRLYLTKSKYYQQKDEQEMELKYINESIQMSPFTGFIRIYKANRLKEMGLINESNQALEECMDKISPLCRQWYLNQPNMQEQ